MHTGSMNIRTLKVHFPHLRRHILSKNKTSFNTLSLHCKGGYTEANHYSVCKYCSNTFDLIGK